MLCDYWMKDTTKNCNNYLKMGKILLKSNLITRAKPNSLADKKLFLHAMILLFWI